MWHQSKVNLIGNLIVHTNLNADHIIDRFNYFQDTQELQIMAPLPIHEQPTTHLFKAITKYTDTIPYDKHLIDVTLHLNHRMQNKDFTNIPDLQLSVAVHPPENDEDDDEAEIEIPRPVIKWVGECGLSSDDNSMIRKLRLMTNSSGETEYALMISLRERSKWQQPKDNSLASKVLRTSPTMDYEDFIPRCIKRSLRFGPVIIQSHVWIDVCEVRYTVFKHGADSHFDFNSKNVETFTEGVRPHFFYLLSKILTLYRLSTQRSRWATSNTS